MGAVGPPGVLLCGVGVELAEGVDEAGVEEGIELVAFFVGEAGVSAVSGGVFEVNFLVSDVEVSDCDDGFCFG